jgi:concanavalin A-like lectin/glucanase superfamily protein
MSFLRKQPLASPSAAAAIVFLQLACGPAPYQVVEVANRCSLHLDGDDDFVDLGTIASGSPTMLAGSPFTLSAWFRQEPGGDPYQRIIDKSDGVLGRNGYALAVDPGEKRIHFYVHGGKKGGDFISVAGAYRMETWHHVAVLARAGGLEIWLDGRRDGRASYESGSHALPADFTTTARLGTWNHEPGRELKGWLDEVAVWNTDLTGDAIEAIYSARGRGDLSRNWGPYDSSGALVAWWRMEAGPGDDSLPLITDSSGKDTPGRPMPDPASANAPTFDCKSVP